MSRDVAYRRASEQIFEFFKDFVSITETKFRLFEFQRYGSYSFLLTHFAIVGTVQRWWRKKLRMHDARREVLKKLWDKGVKELVKQYQSKGKKMAGMVRRLNLLYPELRDKIMTDYYETQRTKYLRMLKTWFKTMKVPEDQPQKKEVSKGRKVTVAKVFAKYSKDKSAPLAMPIFKYKPSKEALSRIILKVAEERIV